jgi:MoaA/NifB/PqqE/SkfB family radical SAM enzyme
VSGPLSAGAMRARLLATFLKGRPVWCTWQVTPRCASFCVFCEHRSEGTTGELDLAGCRAVVRELSALGALLVSLSGADPFLRSDLPEIVSAVAESHFPILTTHGWSVTRERARSVWQTGLLAASVTLHDAEAGPHDDAAGLPGSHARAVAALRVLAEERTRRSQQINVKVSLAGMDGGKLPGLLRLAEKAGASLSVEVPYPLSEARAPGLRARLRKLKAAYPNFRTSDFFLDRVEQALDGGVPGCRAGRSFFNVDHRGRVSKCVEFRGDSDCAGNLAEDGGGDAVIGRLLAKSAENRCQACWMSARGEVEALYTWRGFVGGLATLVRP